MLSKFLPFRVDSFSEERQNTLSQFWKRVYMYSKSKDFAPLGSTFRVDTSSEESQNQPWQSCLPWIQSTVVISKFKGLSKILRDIHTSTYQICKIEEKNKSNNHIAQMNM